MSERWRLFGTKKRRRERYAVRDDAGASVLTAFTLMNPNKTKLKPNEVGSILKGGAAERARSDF